MNKFFVGLIFISLFQFWNTTQTLAAIPVKSIVEQQDDGTNSSQRLVKNDKKKNNKLKQLFSKLEPGRNSLALAIVLTVLMPFLGIAVWQDSVTKDFWITLLLTLLLYLPGLIYALSIILHDAR